MFHTQESQELQKPQHVPLFYSCHHVIWENQGLTVTETGGGLCPSFIVSAIPMSRQLQNHQYKCPVFILLKPTVAMDMIDLSIFPKIFFSHLQFALPCFWWLLSLTLLVPLTFSEIGHPRPPSLGLLSIFSHPLDAFFWHTALVQCSFLKSSICNFLQVRLLCLTARDLTSPLKMTQRLQKL